jgi:hypothetical protein
MVASKRLLAAASLNQSLAVPELFPLPVQALRTETLMLKVSAKPKGTGSGPRSAKGMLWSFALLRPLLPPATLVSSPEPMSVVFR